MRLIGLIIFYSFHFCCVSQNPINEYFKIKGPADEVFVSYYPNGQIKSTYTKKDGNLEGAFTDYYKDGTVEHIGYFENGHFHGTNIKYNEKGSVLFEEAFVHDTLLWSKEREYYKNDTLKQIEYYLFDKDSLKICPFEKVSTSYKWVYHDYDVSKLKSHGQHIKYHKNGKVKEEIPTINDIWEGNAKGYYEDGKLFWEGTYHNNCSDGIFTYYSKTGKIIRKETWVKAKKNKTEKN